MDSGTISIEQELDNLIRKIIHRRGRCERCGSYDYLTQAHIIRRGYHWTRWLPQNSLCLCFNCHRFFTDHPKLWVNYCKYKIGDHLYEYLRKLSLRTDDVPKEEIKEMLLELL